MQLPNQSGYPQTLSYSRQHLDRALALAEGSIPRVGFGENNKVVSPAPVGLSAARMAREAINLLVSHQEKFPVVLAAITHAQRGIELLEQFAAEDTRGFLYVDASYAARIDPYLRGVEALAHARMALL